MTIDPAILAAFTPAPAPSQAASITILSAPPSLPPRVQGEVVQIDLKSGQAVIKTAQGQVIIQTDIPLQVGQKVDIRLAPQAVAPLPVPHAQQAIPATLIPQQVAPPSPAPSPPIAPPVQVDVAVTAPPSPQSDTAPSTLPARYQAPPITQTAVSSLPQLIGQNLAATLLKPVVPPATLSGSLPVVSVPSLLSTSPSPSGFSPQILAGQGPSSPSPSTAINVPPTTNTISSSPSIAVIAPQGTLASPLGGERIQIAFLGILNEANAALQKITQPSTTIAATSGQAAVKGEGLTIPVLAQFIGVTAQKLPVFETLPILSPNGLSTGLPVTEPKSQPSIQAGTRIIVHTPIATNAPLPDGQNIAAMMAKLPPIPATSAQQFALETLPQLAPLFAQILQDPASILSAALAVQVSGMVPKPGTPRFAMNMAMSLLGLSAGDPSSVLPKAVLDALKPDQKAQLQKELKALSGAVRDGAAQGDGVKINLPVDMGGQLYLWQMTIRQDPDRHSGGGNAIEKPTRFILDFMMSNMGEMQVDGLSFARSRRLDLVLRTKTPLDEAAQNLLQKESYGVFERARLTGSIEFQRF